MRIGLILAKVSAAVSIAITMLFGLALGAGAQTPAATPTPARSPMDVPQGTATRAPMMGSGMVQATATPDARFNQQLIESLQNGGHIIYLRHGATERSQQDTDPNNLTNCATQRNLNEQGRSQARAIGEAFRSHNIPVGQVLSSEYCRALEFARLAFNQAQPEQSLVLPDPLPAADQQRNTAALRQLLNRQPTAGVNTVLVSHSPNLRDAMGVDLSVEGSAAIIKPNGQGEPTLVAVVLPNQWSAQAGPNPLPNQMPRTGVGAQPLWEWILPTLLALLIIPISAWRLAAHSSARRK